MKWLFYIFLVVFAILHTPPLLAYDNSDIKFQQLSLKNGLSQSTINSILQDSQGFIWFGTQDGLNKYDGYQFTIYRHNPQDNNSLSNSEVFFIYEDSQQRLWIGTSKGLNLFDRKQETFSHYFHNPEDLNSLSDNLIYSIQEQAETGILWIGTANGLNKFNPLENKFTTFFNNPNNPNSLSHNSIWPLYYDEHTLWIGTDGNGLSKFDLTNSEFKHYPLDKKDANSYSNVVSSIYKDSKQRLWIGTLGGLYQFDSKRETFTAYLHDSEQINSLSHRAVWDIEENQSLLWIATDGGGIDIFNPETKKFIHNKHNLQNKYSISDDAILSLYKDPANTIWIGTANSGINYFNPWQDKFRHYSHNPFNPNSLNNNFVWSIYQDENEELWVGTKGGLNRFSKDRNQVKHYLHDKNNPNSLSHDEVSAIYKGHAGNLWIGTNGGGLNRFDRETEQFTIYQHDPDNNDSLHSNHILSIFEDQAQILWLGTRDGLERFNPKTGIFHHFLHNPEQINSLSNSIVSYIYEDSEGILWIGTDGGLNKFNRETEQFTHYQHDKQDPFSLSHDEISSIYEDKSGTLWIGTTGGGFNRFDKATGKFHAYRQQDGLANDIIYSILEDKQGHLWMASNQGLSHFEPKTEQFRNYDILDGLQSNEFNYAAYKSPTGELFFGGINGFNSFYYGEVKNNPYIPPIAITNFQLFNQTVNFGTDSPLQQAINQTQKITLSYKQTFFSFQFAALNFIKPTKNRYAYQLEGLDENWNQVGDRRYAHYTNVSHGNYIFKVKGSNNDGIWNELGTSIQITILPPPWKTWWAYTLYVLTLLTIIASYIWKQKLKLAAKQRELEQEREIATQLKEMDRLKDEFLANTSHELRTPLNGIIGIAESLVDGATGELSIETNKNLTMIVSSGRRLLNLVNDILDFAKLQKKEFDLQLKAVDIKMVSEIVLNLTQPLIANKPVQLHNAMETNLPLVHADENRLQQILYNLVGNAIKFTEKGTITLSTKILNIKSETDVDSQQSVAITVSDTGIGIPENKLDSIFEAFEQADGSTARVYGGTGLGLAVTQQLVQLHNGQISVNSKVGIGSDFTFTLPILSGESIPTENIATEFKSPLSKVRNEEVADIVPLPEIESKIEPVLMLTGEFNLLIVDDEAVNRQVLINHLSSQNYTIHQAASGMEALKLLDNGYQPDLIVLDIMMPHLSGYEVTRHIRETQTAEQLPIILLTAKTQMADLVMGFESGANDYLTKPISKDELLARLKTHLNVQQLKKERLEAEKKYRNIFENAIEGIFQYNKAGQYLSVNPAFIQIFGYNSVESIYQQDNVKQQCHIKLEKYQQLMVLLKRQNHVKNFRYQARRQDGKIIWVRETVHAVRNNEGELLHYEGMLEDITEHKRAEDKLRYDATHDQLTGLLNRNAFTNHIDNILGNKSQFEIPFAVLYMDLDRFKIVNDSMGHLVGDLLLKEVAHRLSQVIEGHFMVARFGGDEFAVILEDIRNLNELKQYAKQVLKQLSLPYTLNNETFNSTASLGIALTHSKYTKADEILRDADTAMYEAKKQGGNNYVIFQAGMHTHILDVMRMERDLHKALEQDEFQLYYQPIVSLETYETVSLEALIRWQHPEKGLISPEIFIPLAEETGLIADLGLWIFKTACQQLERWQKQFPHHRNLGMNINVSPIQLQQECFVEHIHDIIQQFDILPPTCRVEITEGMMLQDPEESLAIFNQIKEIGMLLYIDDFGTGYSSLSYLQQFPIDALKIDKSFIDNIDETLQSRRVVNAIIALGHAFDLRIVAEGVETQLQIDYLKAAQCNHIQGYFFSKPKNAQEIEAFLKIKKH